jgi:antibiotic biosynthesis monooxygenase (ABM) superfamily enzyme
MRDRVNDPANGAATGEASPVTLVISRRVRAGHAPAYEAWARELQAASRGFPGYRGIGVLRPPPGLGEYTFVLRFDSRAAARAWDAELRREWLPRMPAAAVEGEADVHEEGVEFWFDAPEARAAAAPERWKMALVLSFVVAGLIVLLSPLARAMAAWPLPLRALAIGTIQVLLMTYVVMPRVSRWLARWVRS